MSEPYFIIIGAGTEQEKIYHLAKEMGLKILSTDINPQAHCVQFSDKFVMASTRNPEQTIDALKAININNPIGVITLANDVPLTVARVAEHYGLPAMSPRTAENFASKMLMKQAFQKAGVPTPRYKVVESYEEARHFVENVNVTAYIIKPNDGRGSLGVRYFERDVFTLALFDEVSAIANGAAILIEEFIVGMQISSESYLRENEIFTPALAERNYEKLQETKPIVLEDGGTIPPILASGMEDKIDEVILQAANSLGLEEGTIKGDLVVRDGQIYVIEMAGRLSGGWFASDQIPAASGVDLVKAQLLYALGREVERKSLEPTKNLSTTIRYVWPPFGRIKNITGLTEIQEDERCIKAGIFFSKNDVFVNKEKHSDRFGYVIALGKNRKQSLHAAEELVKKIKVEYYD
jgi:biotin carboxylase